MQAYEVGESRRFAEVRQHAEDIAQRLERLGAAINSLKPEMQALHHQVGTGLAAVIATDLRVEKLQVELASLADEF